MRDALNYANSKGAVFVTAAGNESADNDATSSYPASYRLPNELVVAAVDSSGRLADYSNFGATTVDLAAPGTDVLSTVPGGFASYSGTSMATPFVSGTVALVAAKFRTSRPPTSWRGSKPRSSRSRASRAAPSRRPGRPLLRAHRQDQREQHAPLGQPDARAQRLELRPRSSAPSSRPTTSTTPSEQPRGLRRLRRPGRAGPAGRRGPPCKATPRASAAAHREARSSKRSEQRRGPLHPGGPVVPRRGRLVDVPQPGQGQFRRRLLGDRAGPGRVGRRREVGDPRVGPLLQHGRRHTDGLRQRPVRRPPRPRAGVRRLVLLCRPAAIRHDPRRTRPPNPRHARSRAVAVARLYQDELGTSATLAQLVDNATIQAYGGYLNLG